MKLQGKAILAFNILLAVACVVVGVLGYYTADRGFGVALEEKAAHDLEEIHAVLDARYPGPWESKSDGLYKGAKKFDGERLPKNFLPIILAAAAGRSFLPAAAFLYYSGHYISLSQLSCPP